MTASALQRRIATPGKPLDHVTRNFFESHIGFDFSQVRVHQDRQATRSARQLDALAYTVGQDIVFGAHQYRPQTQAGKRLLAHELIHVVQQSGGQQSDAKDLKINAAPQRRMLQRVPAVSSDCEGSARENVIRAQQLAISWLRFSLSNLRSPDTIAPELNWHFRTTPADTDMLNTIRIQLEGVLAELSGDLIAYSCVPSSDQRCESTEWIAGFAYLGSHNVYFCGNGPREGPESITGTLIHEVLHAKAPSVPDGPYQHDPSYPGEHPDRNADAYTGLVTYLAQGIAGLPRELQSPELASLVEKGSMGYSEMGNRLTTELHGLLAGEATLTEAVQSFLDYFLEGWSEFAREGPTVLRVAGYTDGRSRGERNPGLGMDRAEIVRDFLLESLRLYGITAPIDVQVINYAATRPFTGARTTRGVAANRRVEIEVTRLERPE